MTTLQSYHSCVFEALPQVHISEQSLVANKTHLRELGAVICRHNLQEQVGVSLLHKHFQVLPTERLIKAFVGNKAYIRPHLVSDRDEVTPYLWKLGQDQATGDETYYPLEFVAITGETAQAKEQAKVVSEAKDFLAEMADKLTELGLENVFGISTLHNTNAIQIGTDEALVETTDQEARTLTLSLSPKTMLDSDNSIETSWHFTSIPEGGAVTVCVNCKCTICF